LAQPAGPRQELGSLCSAIFVTRQQHTWQPRITGGVFSLMPR